MKIYVESTDVLGGGVYPVKQWVIQLGSGIVGVLGSKFGTLTLGPTTVFTSGLPSTAKAPEYYAKLCGVKSQFIGDGDLETQRLQHVLLWAAFDAANFKELTGMFIQNNALGDEDFSSSRVEVDSASPEWPRTYLGVFKDNVKSLLNEETGHRTYLFNEQSSALKDIHSWLEKQGKEGNWEPYNKAYQLARLLELLQVIVLTDGEPILGPLSSETKNALDQLPLTKLDLDIDYEAFGNADNKQHGRFVSIWSGIASSYKFNVISGEKDIALSDEALTNGLYLQQLFQMPGYMETTGDKDAVYWEAVETEAKNFFAGYRSWARDKKTTDTTQPPTTIEPLDLDVEQLIHPTTMSNPEGLHKAFWSLAHGHAFDSFLNLVQAVEAKCDDDQKALFQADLAKIGTDVIDRQMDIHRAVVARADAVGVKDELEAYLTGLRNGFISLPSLLGKRAIANVWLKYGPRSFALTQAQAVPN